jgi:hypothetical protein
MMVYLGRIRGPNRPTDTGAYWVAASDSNERSPWPPFPLSAGIVEHNPWGADFNCVLDNAGARPRDAIDAQMVADFRAGTGNIKNGVAATTLFWPRGLVNSVVGDSVILAINSEGTSVGRYANLFMDIDYGGNGSWVGSDTRQITSNPNSGGFLRAGLVSQFSPAPTPGVDSVRVRQVISAPVTAGYPTYTGSYTDTDSDGIPDYVETNIGSNPSVSDAMTKVGDYTYAEIGMMYLIPMPHK